MPCELLARIDEVQVVLVLDELLQHREGNVLWAIVDAQTVWLSSHRGAFIECADYSKACWREIRIQSKTFTSRTIFDRQNADLAAREHDFEGYALFRQKRCVDVAQPVCRGRRHSVSVHRRHSREVAEVAATRSAIRQTSSYKIVVAW